MTVGNVSHHYPTNSADGNNGKYRKNNQHAISGDDEDFISHGTKPRKKLALSLVELVGTRKSLQAIKSINICLSISIS